MMNVFIVVMKMSLETFYKIINVKNVILNVWNASIISYKDKFKKHLKRDIFKTKSMIGMTQLLLFTLTIFLNIISFVFWYLI